MTWNFWTLVNLGVLDIIGFGSEFGKLFPCRRMEIPPEGISHVMSRSGGLPPPAGDS
jgi:hypothetical protein